MSTRRLNVGNIVAEVFDGDFGFSDCDSREDIYADRGDAVIEWQRLRKETRRLTVQKYVNGVMLQIFKTSKRTQK